MLFNSPTLYDTPGLPSPFNLPLLSNMCRKAHDNGALNDTGQASGPWDFSPLLVGARLAQTLIHETTKVESSMFHLFFSLSTFYNKFLDTTGSVGLLKIEMVPRPNLFVSGGIFLFGFNIIPSFSAACHIVIRRGVEGVDFCCHLHIIKRSLARLGVPFL